MPCRWIAASAMATVIASFGSTVETACVMPINVVHCPCAAADVTAARTAIRNMPDLEPDIRPSRLVACGFIARERADCHRCFCADAAWVSFGGQNHDPGTREVFIRGGFSGYGMWRYCC